MGMTQEDRIPPGHDIISSIYEELEAARTAFCREHPELAALAPFDGGCTMLLLNTVLLLSDEVANLREELEDVREALGKHVDYGFHGHHNRSPKVY